MKVITIENIDLVGLVATDAIFELLKSAGVSKCTFLEYSPPPILQNRLNIRNDEQYAINEAMSIRDKYSLPFWDSMMLSRFGKETIPKRILEEALYHQKNNNYIHFTDEQINKDSFCELINNLPNQRWLAITSQVIRNGKKMHIPILDFHCPSNDNINIKLVDSVCQLLLPHGFIILNSGKSYHVYGMALYSSNELHRFLCKSLLFTPIIDRAYLAHQLLEGRCSLRISPGGNEKMQPYVVHVNYGTEV